MSYKIFRENQNYIFLLKLLRGRRLNILKFPLKFLNFNRYLLALINLFYIRVCSGKIPQSTVQLNEHRTFSDEIERSISFVTNQEKWFLRIQYKKLFFKLISFKGRYREIERRRKENVKNNIKYHGSNSPNDKHPKCSIEANCAGLMVNV